jgi:hypothetical protein
MMSSTGEVLLVPNGKEKVEVLGQRARPAAGNDGTPSGLTVRAVCLDLLTPTETVPRVSIAGRGQSLWQVPFHAEHVSDMVRLEPLVCG